MRETLLPRFDSSRLSYASISQPRLKQLVIRSIEEISGRRRYERLYERWRSEVIVSRDMAFTRMLEMVDVRLHCRGNWPPMLPDRPLVMLANHPFGIGDELAMLAIAEKLTRMCGLSGSAFGWKRLFSRH